MNEIIENALKGVGTQCFAIVRPKNTIPAIVYNYNEYPSGAGDNTEETVKYDIYINVFAKENINTLNKKVKDALKNAKFTKIYVNSPLKMEGTDFFQTTMNYIKVEVAE